MGDCDYCDTSMFWDVKYNMIDKLEYEDIYKELEKF